MFGYGKPLETIEITNYNLLAVSPKVQFRCEYSKCLLCLQLQDRIYPHGLTRGEVKNGAHKQYEEEMKPFFGFVLISLAFETHKRDDSQS